MSTEDAKAYLASREVPRLFECLMTGLMFHRPNDHVQYLIESLEKVKAKGQAAVTWDMFVDVNSAKKPLPPISPDNGKKPPSRAHSKDDESFVTSTKTSPLPPISSGSFISGPVIFVMGGPCSGKSAQASRLAARHSGWFNVHLGELIRTEIHKNDGQDKWKAAKDLIISGQLAPEDITIDLLQQFIKNNTQASGFIIHGFPRNMEQIKIFEKNIGRVDAVLLVDCGEEKLTNNATSRANRNERLDETPSAFENQMLIFKEQTLPVLKYFDDGGKLYIVDGDQDEESIHEQLSQLFENLLRSVENGKIPTPPPGSRPSTSRWSRLTATPTAPPFSPPPHSPSSSPLDSKLNLPTVPFVPPPEVKVKDEGRRSELPTAPIIFLAGGPGSGKGTQCKRITSRYSDIVHISMGDILRREISKKGNADDKWNMIMKLLKQGDMAPVDVTEEILIRFMQDNPDALAYLVEGYPRDALQYEQFNRNIGGHAFTILLDCESQYLYDRLVLRGGSGNDRIDDNIPAIEKKLTFFARNTLPLLKVIEDEGKLIVIDGDKSEDDVFHDIVKCLDSSLYELQQIEGKASTEGDKSKSDGEEDEDDDEQGQIVEEEEFVAATSTRTGDDDGNPNYSALLDTLDPIVMIELDAQEEFALEEEQEEKTLEESKQIEIDNIEDGDIQDHNLLASEKKSHTLESGVFEYSEQTAEKVYLKNKESTKEEQINETELTNQVEESKEEMALPENENDDAKDEIEQTTYEIEQTNDEMDLTTAGALLQNTEKENITDEIEQTTEDFKQINEVVEITIKLEQTEEEIEQTVSDLEQADQESYNLIQTDIVTEANIGDDNDGTDQNFDNNVIHDVKDITKDNQEQESNETDSAEKLVDSVTEGEADNTTENIDDDNNNNDDKGVNE